MDPSHHLATSLSRTPVKFAYVPSDVPTDANAAKTPRRCGCDTSAVYTLDGAPIIPELMPTRNRPTQIHSTDIAKPTMVHPTMAGICKAIMVRLRPSKSVRQLASMHPHGVPMVDTLAAQTRYTVKQERVRAMTQPRKPHKPCPLIGRIMYT